MVEKMFFSIDLYDKIGNILGCHFVAVYILKSQPVQDLVTDRYDRKFFVSSNPSVVIVIAMNSSNFRFDFDYHFLTTFKN